jgi:glycerol-3-phosphate dehydrogenase
LVAPQAFDLLVVGGGIHGAAVARDAAGRGLKVMLAERGDYACATSSASSKLIHGGLRYLESGELGLVRESLAERAGLLKTAPHLVAPLRFLLPVYSWQKRQALKLRAGLALYDVLSLGGGLPASGRLDDDDISQLPRLRQDELGSVLRYWDCVTDDARLTLAVLLDARARGADIRNRRAVTAIAALADGYAADLDERGLKRRIEARFIVNAAGPWLTAIDAMTEWAPPPRVLRLVRGSHIVLKMPDKPQSDAYTLQDQEERVVFVIPWLGERFLIIGTTDVPHHGDAATAQCSAEEATYLLAAYNRYFAHPGGPATEADIVFTWSGVRTLEDDASAKPSHISRSPVLSSVANGTGGFVTLYGGKLTTHRALAEEVMDELRKLGASAGDAWTKSVPLYGGTRYRPDLLSRAAHGPEGLSLATRQRFALTYGDKIDTLFGTIAADPGSAEEIAPGVTRAELEYAVEAEDALTAEDFLLRRTKLHLLLDDPGRDAVAQWFGRRIG